jgi:hypothetical protein
LRADQLTWQHLFGTLCPKFDALGPGRGRFAFQGVHMAPSDLLPGDVTTAAEFARRVGIDRSRINAWRTRGYLDEHGQRVRIKPCGTLPNGRPVYLAADLEDAEHATRYRAPNRGNEVIAADQERHRAMRDAA